MKQLNKRVLYIAITIIIILISVMAFVFSDKKLDLESKQVNDLYKFLGEVDIYHCGGLITYQDKDISIKDINKENALCMAYYNHKLNSKDMVIENIKSTDKNEHDIKICKIGDITFTTEEDNCTYIKFNKRNLNIAYKNLYGEEIKDYTEFYISSKEACYLEGEEYYCGNAETYTLSLVPESTIYRLIDKAVKKLNGDIVIYDYYLKASDSKCYTTNNKEKEECNKALNNNKIDVKFIKKYGTLYKHTFKLDSNNNHYWLKTELT
ncbi:MAG: hypothetical protein E7163_01305 [Firmicutes bacterium]|nr:hypothetical protein [Bacillota bacterium]